MKSLISLQLILISRYVVLSQLVISAENVTSIEHPPEKSRESKDDVKDETTNEDDIVVTKSGPVLGHTEADTPNIRRFYDIPYGSFSSANPFLEPSPAEPWEKVHDESEHKSRCPQIKYPDTFVGSVNCLTLSIMTPKSAVNADVLFHIHGGTFNTGSGDPSIYGPEFITPKGIILVLPNYRLGALGFLCSHNVTVPGNAALKDLTLALKWVKDNIAAFGGNPQNIVVSGESTAGALAGYLAVSPASRDYVSKVIAESGFVLSHWAIDRDPLTKAENLLGRFSRPIDTIVTMSKLFDNVYIEALIVAAKNMTFAPCVETGERPFIRETPWNMLRGLKTNVPYMIGSTSHAGMQEALQQIDSSLYEINNDFGSILPDDLDLKNNDNEGSRIANKIRAQYFGKDEITRDDVELLSFFHTDASYLGPMLRAARYLVATDAPVYFYEFSFTGDLNQELDPTIKVHGAIRGDVVRYVFCRNGQVPEENSKEIQMVALLTQLLSSFIHTGKPTASGVEWHQLEQTTQLDEKWLLIGSEVKPQKGMHLERLKLWTEIYETNFVEHNGAIRLPPYIYSFMFTFLLFVCLSKVLV